MRNLIWFFIAVFFALSSCSGGYEFSSDTVTIECGAEKTSGDQLVAGEYLLGWSEMQTDKKARTGKYSIALNEKTPDGFIFETKNIEKGASFVISVWKELSTDGGQIIISGDGSEGGLLKENGTVIQRKDGWGLIQIHFTAHKPYDEVRFFVSHGGKESVYFDDFKIGGYFNQKIPETEENALRIELSPTVLDTLAKFREIALEQGVITGDLKEYVQGSILKDGVKIPIELRLKGDWTDHLESDKWSFRIKVPGDNAWEGLKSFSIQHPSTRAFMNEWFAHKLFEHEDVLTTTYRFVPVIINGEKRGVYAMEEHFDKQLLESRNRREGPIVKYDESGVWEQHLLETTEHKFYRCPTLLSANIRPFKKGRTYRTRTLKKSFLMAQSHMERYRNHDPDVDAYFDLESTARFLALLEVVNGKHGLIWHNQRNYLNPVTNKLEPIAFDCFTDEANMDRTVHLLGLDWAKKNHYSITEALLAHPELNDRYLEYIRRYSDEAFLNEVFRKLNEEINELEKLLKHEYPFYSFDREFYTSNCEQIRSAIPEFEKLRTDVAPEDYAAQLYFDKLPENVIFSKIALKANVVKRDSLLTEIELANYHSSPLKVIGYKYKGTDTIVWLDNAIELKAFDTKPARFKATFIQPKRPGKFLYQAENCGDSLFVEKVSKWPSAKIVEVPEVESELKIRKREDVWRIPAGRYAVSEDVIIPRGVKLVFDAGVSIDLKNSAAFISNSPVWMIGRESQQINIYSSDTTSSGFIVLSGGGQSVLKYVNFNGLNTVNRDFWTLTGAVTIYEGDVELENCTFRNSRSEDALNLIRCSFTMKNCLVEKTASDGFDADFCTGKVLKSRFEQIGNDCIDFSGSEITINGCTILNGGDKGISGGEKSNLTIEDCSIDGVAIGIASKDLSQVRVKDVALMNCKYGFAAYQKKPEYGSAEIDVESIRKEGYEELYLLEKGSELDYRGKTYTGTEKFNIEEMYAAFAK